MLGEYDYNDFHVLKKHNRKEFFTGMRFLKHMAAERILKGETE
jgi:hypothetical protein